MMRSNGTGSGLRGLHRSVFIAALVPLLCAGVLADSEVGRGILYQNDRTRAGPWSVHVLKVDRSRADLNWTTALARNRVLGVATLTRQIAGIPAEFGQPLAAMNGGFFREHDFYAGDPRGLQILHGELVSAPDGNASFWIDPRGSPNISNVVSQFHVIWPNGERIAIGLNEDRGSDEAVLYTPRMGPATGTSGGRELILERIGQSTWLPFRPGLTYPAVVREIRGGNSRISPDTMVLSLGRSLAEDLPAITEGSILKISAATAPALNGVAMALGAGPVLVRNGKVPSIRASKSNDRHPRAAIGWNATHFFLVAVDGRQEMSVGMTLPELGMYLAQKGCTDAMNLDGGGSVELWVEGRIMNSPCYGHERPTANAVVLVQKPGAAKPVTKFP